MKKLYKVLIAFGLCSVLVLTSVGAAFAADGKSYKNLPYTYYTYLGDSIPFGYGLVSQEASSDPYSVGTRVPNSYPDLVGDVLEDVNGAHIQPAACSGARLMDYRILLERGMGVENPYDRPSDWYGNRKAERTERLRGMGPEIVRWVQQSDLVSIQAGFNDITAALVNAAYATGIVDLNKLQGLSDADAVLDYLSFALNNLEKDPDLLGNFTRTFSEEMSEMFTNAYVVIKDLQLLAPNKADILLVGYNKAVASIRVIPGTDRSLLFDLVDEAIMAFDGYFAFLATQYDNVHYVHVPDAETVYPKGTTVFDMLKDTGGILLGIHANEAGHRYIADRILDTLQEINQ